MNNQPFPMEQYRRWIQKLNFERSIAPWKSCGFSWAAMLHQSSPCKAKGPDAAFPQPPRRLAPEEAEYARR
jgi:hypothetical protein